MKQADELKLLTEKQMAEALSVSTRTTRRLRQQKILPFYKLGRGLIRYNQQQCAEALEQYRVKSSNELREEQSHN